MVNVSPRALLILAVLLAVFARLLWPQPAAGSFSGQEESRRVVRAYFEERKQVQALAAWREPWDVNYEERFLVLDTTQVEEERLRATGFRLEVDLGLTRALGRPPKVDPGQAAGIPGYACYRTVEETFTTAAGLAATYPQLATWADAGDSWEKSVVAESGYDIRVLRLTNAEVPGPKPGLFVMSSLHAREYAPAELNTRFAEYLLANYGVDADVTWLLDYHKIHLLFQANPDGRKQAESGLLWRKNVNEDYCSPNSGLRGADLNRNFPFQWGCCNGSSANTCSEIYRGPSPASEPETKALTGYLKAHFLDQREPGLMDQSAPTATGVFLDLHSYGGWVLWPWGFTEQPAPDGQALTTLGRRLAYFNGYYPSQASGLYPTDGTTDDFAYGELGLAAYTFEIGSEFFQDCARFETQIWPQNLSALLYAAKVARAPYLLPAGPVVSTLTLHRHAGTATFTVTGRVDDGRYNTQNGTEPVQPLATARYFLDLPPWLPEATPKPLAAMDGSFDSSVEVVSATIDAGSLTPGRHTLFLQGEDAEGNWGTISAIFLEVAPPFTETVYLPSVRR